MSCREARERAPELALGVLSGSERAEVLEHLARCAGCRAEVGELAEIADLLPSLAPEAETPAGFEGRVLSAMRGDRRRARLRRVATALTAAAAAAIVSIAVVRVVDAGRAPDRVEARPTLRTVAMVATDGVPVGHVAISGAGDVSLSVSVDYRVPDGSYTLEVQPSGGVARPIGTIAVSGGRGAWEGHAPVPGGRATISMYDDAGTLVCHAAVPAV